MNVRTNHVHRVVHADADAAKVMNTLKARVTRELRRYGLIGEERDVWARGVGKRKLFDESAVLTTIDYVLNQQ